MIKSANKQQIDFVLMLSKKLLNDSPKSVRICIKFDASYDLISPEIVP